VCFLQDHDQVGNRAIGDRIGATVPKGLLDVGATLLLTSPFTPMLFMGEEWAAGTPWLFFTSHPEPELAEVTAAGRQEEFAGHGWGAEEVPDPQEPDTFLRSRLDWAELDKEPHSSTLATYRALLRLRRDRPELADPRLDRVGVDYDDQAGWLVVRRGDLRVACNLSEQPTNVPLDGPVSAVLLHTAEPDQEPPSVTGALLSMPPQSAAVVELAAD
jgi:maltooligosyltrehalose trehalohydrolase